MGDRTDDCWPDGPAGPGRRTGILVYDEDAYDVERQPRGILAPTFGDTLRISGTREARVFGISGKDRSAVAMAGQTGTAYWYSTNNGDFQSSAYYMDGYPSWVSDWNGERNTEKLGGKAWELLLPKASYLLADQDDRPYEVDLRGYGRTFPHAFGPAKHPLFFTRVLVSPEGDRLLANFAKSLIEAEDTVLQLDRTLAELLKFVDKRIGLDETLIVLSADHGMAEMPEYATERGHPAGRLYSHEVLAARAKQLNEPAVAHNHHPTRSGDIYVYQDPHWFLFDKGPVGVMHGSPWAYDRHVPLIFAGPGGKGGTSHRLVHPIDVAPTLSALLRLPPPAAAQGSALVEVR